MSFESQAVRNSRTKFVKTVVFDVLLAFGIASLNSSSDAFWITFGLVLGVIWILPLLFWWKGALYKYIFYHLEKRGRIDNLKHEFRRRNCHYLTIGLRTRQRISLKLRRMRRIQKLLGYFREKPRGSLESFPCIPVWMQSFCT